jgi:hypothetical protein
LKDEAIIHLKEAVMVKGKWRNTVLFSLLAGALGLHTAARATNMYAPQIDITGTYNCSGNNPGSTGNGYHGTATISKAGSTYLMSWSIAGTSYTGIGIKNGTMLSVSWYSAGQTGIVVYHISPNGTGVTLNGQWAGMGANGLLGTETLTR